MRTLHGACYLWWSSVLPGSKSVAVLSKDLVNLEPHSCDPGYAPGTHSHYISSYLYLLNDFVIISW